MRSRRPVSARPLPGTPVCSAPPIVRDRVQAVVVPACQTGFAARED
jgi:hypothetical protein